MSPIAASIAVGGLDHAHGSDDDDEEFDSVESLATKSICQMTENDHANCSGADGHHVDGQSGLAKVIIADRIHILKRRTDDITGEDGVGRCEETGRDRYEDRPVEADIIEDAKNLLLSSSRVLKALLSASLTPHATRIF